MTAFCRMFRPGLALAVLTASLPAAVASQASADLRRAENFRDAPNGPVLGRLAPPATVRILDRAERWLRVRVEGWMWTRSLQIAERDGFDLVVSEPAGENLRDAPSGRLLGRFERGTLLREEERRPGWIRIVREGWLWSDSVEEPTDTPAPAPADAPVPAPADASDSVPGVAAPRAPRALLSGPDGDTLASVRPTADVDVLDRRGGWARVRVEGWTWMPPTADGDDEAPAALTPADLAADPAGAAGRRVAWPLLFISLERAERLRTDFFEDEPFMLTRWRDEDGPFVYVAVPPDRLADVEALAPFDTVRVVGRIRTAAASLTGAPILDLVSFERPARDR